MRSMLVRSRDRSYRRLGRYVPCTANRERKREREKRWS